MNISDLDRPFKNEDLEWRISRSGSKDGNPWATCLVYITARAIHDRLDEVCGKENWQTKYHEHLGGTVCRIGIKIDNEWIWKSGGSDQTQFEAFKGGLSGSEKRAGVPWGIGRYLYNLDEGFAVIAKNGSHYQAKQNGKNGKPDTPAFKWEPPLLPEWAQYKEALKFKGGLDFFFKLLQASNDMENLKFVFRLYSDFAWTQDEIKEITEEKDRIKDTLMVKK